MAAKLPTVEVPAEEFALLMAYCHTPQTEVPEWVRKHPRYPANTDHRYGHLTKALRTAQKEALETIRGR